MDAMPPSPERLFFAVWPGDAVRARIAANASRLHRDGDRNARMVDAARYHLTLQFIGTYAPLPAVLVDTAIAAGNAQRAAGFELVLDRLGSFGNGRVSWMGPSQVPHALGALVEGLGRSLSSCATVAPGTLQSFVPHLTLARHLTLPPEKGIEPVHWSVDAFALFASGATPSGYRQLAHWTLQPRQAPA
jgi:2'-5' RNA ligase